MLFDFKSTSTPTTKSHGSNSFLSKPPILIEILKNILVEEQVV